MHTLNILLLVVLSVLSTSSIAQVFRCGEPKGVAMWSTEGHMAAPDGYTGVKPIVVVDKKEMTIVWGDSKPAGGQERVWKAIVIRRNLNSVSAVALDSGPNASATVLYTMDMKRGFLYMSTHKEVDLPDASASSSFVATCGK
jgi:hypothetical protein